MPIAFCASCRKAWVFERLDGKEVCTSCHTQLEPTTLAKVRPHLLPPTINIKGGEKNGGPVPKAPKKA